MVSHTPDQVTEKTAKRKFHMSKSNVDENNGQQDFLTQEDEHSIQDRYNFHDASFRRHYQLNYSDGTHEYEEYYAAAYRFGYQLAKEYPGAEWSAIASDAQHHWQLKHDSAWENVINAVQYGWKEQRDPDALRVNHVGEYEDYQKGFLAHYAAEIDAGGNSNFDHYEPAYRRGYELAVDPAYRTHLWSEMEPELRQYYEEEYANDSVTWDHYRSAAQYAWHDVRAMGV